MGKNLVKIKQAPLEILHDAEHSFYEWSAEGHKQAFPLLWRVSLAVKKVLKETSKSFEVDSKSIKTRFAHPTDKEVVPLYVLVNGESSDSEDLLSNQQDDEYMYNIINRGFEASKIALKECSHKLQQQSKVTVSNKLARKDEVGVVYTENIMAAKISNALLYACRNETTEIKVEVQVANYKEIKLGIPGGNMYQEVVPSSRCITGQVDYASNHFHVVNIHCKDAEGKDKFIKAKFQDSELDSLRDAQKQNIEFEYEFELRRVKNDEGKEHYALKSWKQYAKKLLD